MLIEMDWQTLAFAGAGLFCAGIVKGATGIGYSSCALPFLVSSVGLRNAIALLVIPAMASNVALLFNAGHFRESWRRFWLLYFATLPGIVLGIAFLSWIGPRTPTQILGAVIVLYSAYSHFRPSFGLAPSTARAIQAPVGFANGFLTGLTGSQIMPLLPYMMALQLKPGNFVQAVNIAVVTASAFLAGALWFAAILTPQHIQFSSLGAIPALAGVHIGNRSRSYISPDRFRTLILVSLGLIGISLLMRS